LVVLIAATLLASAGTVVTSIAGGAETAVDQPWTGIDVALWPTKENGTEMIGRLQGGWGWNGGPLVNLQVGVLTRLPEDEAILRGGVVAKLTFDGDKKHFPIDLTDGDFRYGLLPAVLTHVEFDWGGESPHAVGFQAGWGPRPSNHRCAIETPETECLVWTGGFHGGFFARKQMKSGFAAEIYFGTSNHLTIGKAW